MNEDVQYLLASIVESSQDSIVTIDLNRIITSWNRGAENLYGFKAGEMVGKTLEIVMLPADIKELIINVEKIIHEVTVPIFETIRHHKNGKDADLEIVLSPVRNAAGKVVGVSTIGRDITLRKLQEQQKDEFIAVASHELKTPVTSIKGYTQILLEHADLSTDPSVASIIKRLDHQVDKMTKLIGTLLDTTRLRAGELLLKKAPLDLNTVIEDYLEDAQLISQGRYITFHAGEIPSLSADRKLIEQVLVNIITNAIKYSPDRGEIVIETMVTGDGVQVSIQDFGFGIPAADVEKIFDRYFRVGNRLTTNSPGIGLGLYITSEIIHQHGGTISVESEEGYGSTFYFTLPFDRINEALHPQTGSESDQAASPA